MDFISSRSKIHPLAEALSASDVVSLLDTTLQICLANAKDVKNTMSESTETEDSVNLVTTRFLLDLNGADIENTNKKCSKCGVVTPNQWLEVKVLPTEPDFDPMKAMEMRKRLVLCCNCGNITVTK